jgi:hypothetical protein
VSLQCCSGLSCLNYSCQAVFDAGTQQCGFTSSDPTCESCLTDYCCASGEACYNDSTCTSCVTSTSPPSNCTSNIAFNNFANCYSSYCTSACSGIPQGDAGAPSACGLGTSMPACDTCMDTSCLAQCGTCSATGSPCMTFLTCAGACASGDQTCVNNCATQSPTGASEYDALITCLQTSCATQCPGI